MNKNNPKISIIIPTLNSAHYLKECVESVLNQSLRDIEVIAVDAKSTDGTLEILQDYAKGDSRLSVIISERKSYGYQMNLGIAKGKGEYIGIVESDDFAKPTMFERLYSIAKAQDCDIVKSDILCFHTENDAYKFTHTPIIKNARFYNQKFIFDSHLDSNANSHSNHIKTKILKTAWKMNQSSIFKRDFLEKHSIRFNESQGASYQDTGFSFITTILADSLYVLDEAHYCYRTDNESSSSNDKGKVYCICDEYDYIARFLERENLMDAYFGLFYYLKFCGYWWNVGRIATESKLKFLMRFQKDFSHLSKAQIKSCGFKWHQRRKLAKILDSPRDFYAELLEPKPKGLWQKIKHYLKYDLKFTQKRSNKCNQKSQS